jgi:hypothetical protein
MFIYILLFISNVLLNLYNKFNRGEVQEEEEGSEEHFKIYQGGTSTSPLPKKEAYP